jgi:hypothetical protein
MRGGNRWSRSRAAAGSRTWRDVVEIMELPAGPHQILVVYGPADTGNELDPTEILGGVAADAAARAAEATGSSRWR